MTDWAAVSRKIADVAPMLGTVVGGPAGAVIGTVIASTLGTANDPKAVLAKLASDPEAMLKLKQIESDERVALQGQVVSLAQSEMLDQQQARTAHQDHWMPATLTIVLAMMTSAVTYGVLTTDVPGNSKEVAFFIVGQILTAFITAVSFWLGSSRSSSVKTKLLGGTL